MDLLGLSIFGFGKLIFFFKVKGEKNMKIIIKLEFKFNNYFFYVSLNLFPSFNIKNLKVYKIVHIVNMFIFFLFKISLINFVFSFS